MSAANPRGAVLALLADCKENPSEDGFRLILADWLDENGDGLDQARAELIRCQISYGCLPIDDPSRDGHGRRARWLQQRHGKAWLGPLAPWGENGCVQRGLVALMLTVVSLRSKALAELAGGEAWAWVEELQVTHADDHDFRHLTSSPLLRALSAIGFQRSQIGPAGAQALAQMPWLGRIARLDLSLNPVGDAGLLRLLRSPHLTRLRELALDNASLLTEAGGVLAQAGCAARLDRLSLSGNHLGDPGVVGLTRHAPLAGLRFLNLRGNGLRDLGAEALARAESLPALRVLDLRDNGIGPRGAAALAESPRLAGLERLVLYGNPVGADGAARLVGRFGGRVHVSPVGS
jgi:uncharacterized protein (TIGR02996 family)